MMSARLLTRPSAAPPGRPSRPRAGRRAPHRAVAALAVTGLLAVTASGCGASRGTGGQATAASVARPAPVSAWQQTLDRVGRRGKVSKATALSAFALAIGPMPGARRPAGPAQVIASGTVAVQWVLGHWGQLNGRQRRAVRADLGVPARPAARTAATRRGPAATPARTELTSLDISEAGTRPAAPAPAAGPDLPCLAGDAGATGAYRSQLAGIESDIAAHVGAGPFSPDVYFSVNTAQLEGAATKMYTYGCTGTQVTASGPVSGCTIHVNPAVSGGAFPPAEVHDFLIHELLHCYLFLHLGAAYYQMPAWYVEGAAMWAMTELGSGSTIESKDWLAYLDTPSSPLFGRTYDALGFFVHLAETGTDVWHKIMPMGQALAGGGSAAGWRAAAPTPAFLDSWGSGYAQGRYPGTAWQTSGPHLPHYEGPVPQASVDDGQTITVHAPATATAISHVDLDAQVVVLTDTGPGRPDGRLSLDDGADATLAQAAGTTYATGSQASCPAGTADAGTPLTPISSGLHYVTVTGGLDAASVQVTGQSLASYCARTAAPCVVGTWTSARAQAADPSLFTEHGGAGVTMKVGADGSVSIDFDGMAPIFMTSSNGTADHFVFGGVVTGQVQVPAATAETSPFALRPAPGSPLDYSSLTTTITITSPIQDTIGPISVAQLAGSVAGGAASGVDTRPLSAGTWSCHGDTLVNRAPAGVPADGSWTWARAS
jgi:hypothetical protein